MCCLCAHRVCLVDDGFLVFFVWLGWQTKLCLAGHNGRRRSVLADANSKCQIPGSMPCLFVFFPIWSSFVSLSVLLLLWPLKWSECVCFGTLLTAGAWLLRRFMVFVFVYCILWSSVVAVKTILSFAPNRFLLFVCYLLRKVTKNRVKTDEKNSIRSRRIRLAVVLTQIFSSTGLGVVDSPWPRQCAAERVCAWDGQPPPSSRVLCSNLWFYLRSVRAYNNQFFELVFITEIRTDSSVCVQGKEYTQNYPLVPCRTPGRIKKEKTSNRPFYLFSTS